MAVLLEFYRLRFRFQAQEEIRFPKGKAGNVLRGAFGTILRDAAIVERLPRPFVFRASHLDGCTFSPGMTFEFEMNLFDLSLATREQVVATFAAIAEQGLGASRAKARLLDANASECSIGLLPPTKPVKRVEVSFRTPTELKADNEIVGTPEFRVLWARLFERLNSLSVHYGSGPLNVDRRYLNDLARTIQLSHCFIATSHIERLSSRTGQRHRVGGFKGSVTYEGELTEFVPFLQAGEFTGVGRHTAWGNGELGVLFLSHDRKEAVSNR